MTVKKVEAATGTAKLSDGAGLYLMVRNDKKRWALLYSLSGRRREMGLGSFPDVTLADARRKAAEAKAKVLAGEDPIAEKRKEGLTFGIYADRFINERKASWRGERYEQSWRRSVEFYAKKLTNRSLDDISTEDILSILKPIWVTKYETAHMCQMRLEMVLDSAKAEGLRQGDNPARWRGHLDKLMPKRKKIAKKHFAAMPAEDVPAFMQVLKQRPTVAAMALRMVILTAARSTMVRKARWDEIRGDVWTVPGERMKGGEEFQIPLSTQSLALLETIPRVSDFVFPGRTPKKAFTAKGMLEEVKDRDVTVHGFRSTFRDWAGDNTSFSWEVMETCLAHKVGNETSRAYRRSDLLDKRAQLMQDWADYLSMNA